MPYLVIKEMNSNGVGYRLGGIGREGFLEYKSHFKILLLRFGKNIADALVIWKSLSHF